jgi:hypothetical protein
MNKTKDIHKKNKEKNNKKIDEINNDLNLFKEYDIETYETNICLEDGSFIEIDIDKIENEI